MDKSYCKKIDKDLLVEKYVEGKMNAEERQEFEQHLRECPVHAQAVALEKSLHRGISEFARSEIRTRLKRSIQKREDIRFYVVRYAAILFLVVITPLILYYQFYVPQWDEIPSKQIPLPPESSKLKGEKTEELQFENQSYEKEEQDAKLSPAMKSNQLSEQTVTPVDLKKKIDYISCRLKIVLAIFQFKKSTRYWDAPRIKDPAAMHKDRCSV